MCTRDADAITADAITADAIGVVQGLSPSAVGLQGFGFYHEAYQRYQQREQHPNTDCQEHANAVTAPAYQIEVLLWCVHWVLY